MPRDLVELALGVHTLFEIIGKDIKEKHNNSKDLRPK
jgi:hypothetical protein